MGLLSSDFSLLLDSFPAEEPALRHVRRTATVKSQEGEEDAVFARLLQLTPFLDKRLQTRDALYITQAFGLSPSESLKRSPESMVQFTKCQDVDATAPSI